MVLSWIQQHFLETISLGVTLVFLYYHLKERDSGVKLSKKYRHSIYEAQSHIFLNATQYLIKGDKDLAIKEFLNAVDLNSETVETYFALGGLFRSNGEIDKAISIHRSLIARDNISEMTRFRGLKELAMDFDKGGLIDKAIETYQDVLKINRDQKDVVGALCRIYENIQDWDSALKFRLMLSKVTQDNQSETISHILVQKAKMLLDQREYSLCQETLEEAYRYSPSVSAKILRLRYDLIQGYMEDAKENFKELLKGHPHFTSFALNSLDESLKNDTLLDADYPHRLESLKKYFLQLNEKEIMMSASIMISKIKLLKENSQFDQAYDLLKNWMDIKNHQTSDHQALKVEYIDLLIHLDKWSEAIGPVKDFLSQFKDSMTRHFCGQCGYNTDEVFWRCPQCYQWETIQFRLKT
jgi:lipopolysaccharide biosynthesis regulator YciM